MGFQYEKSFQQPNAALKQVYIYLVNIHHQRTPEKLIFQRFSKFKNFEEFLVQHGPFDGNQTFA